MIIYYYSPLQAELREYLGVDYPLTNLSNWCLKLKKKVTTIRQNIHPEKFDPYIINSNFVTTERIFKIRSSAESYCLAESRNYWGGRLPPLTPLVIRPCNFVIKWVLIPWKLLDGTLSLGLFIGLNKLPLQTFKKLI